MSSFREIVQNRAKALDVFKKRHEIMREEHVMELYRDMINKIAKGEKLFITRYLDGFYCFDGVCDQVKFRSYEDLLFFKTRLEELSEHCMECSVVNIPLYPKIECIFKTD